jgi:hypothetical protein
MLVQFKLEMHFYNLFRAQFLHSTFPSTHLILTFKVLVQVNFLTYASNFLSVVSKVMTRKKCKLNDEIAIFKKEIYYCFKFF